MASYIIANGYTALEYLHVQLASFIVEISDAW